MLVNEVPPTFHLSSGKSRTEQEMSVSSASRRLSLGLASRRVHVEVLDVGVRRAFWGQYVEQRRLVIDDIHRFVSAILVY